MHQNNFFNSSPFSLPHTFCFGNKRYEVRTCFKNWIKLCLLSEDKTLSDEDKILITLDLVFLDRAEVLKDVASGVVSITDIFQAIQLFLNCNEEVKESGEERKKLFDFKQDWDYIYSAFMQQYKVDLNDEKLHWFKFMSLFKGLSTDTEFLKIIDYRGADLNKLDKEQKKFYRKMKERYALVDEYKISEGACLDEEDVDEIIRNMSRR